MYPVAFPKVAAWLWDEICVACLPVRSERWRRPGQQGWGAVGAALSLVHGGVEHAVLALLGSKNGTGGTSGR